MYELQWVLWVVNNFEAINTRKCPCPVVTKSASVRVKVLPRVPPTRGSLYSLPRHLAARPRADTCGRGLAWPDVV